MNRQNKRTTVTIAAFMAIAFGAGVGVSQIFVPAKADDVPEQQAQLKLKKVPPLLLQFAKCTSTFKSAPGVVKLTPPKTQSYLCTANIPPCAKPYARAVKPYGKANNSFHYDCGVPVKCHKNYDLIAHQQSATKFQYKCVLKANLK